MKLSEQWLRDWVSPDLNSEQLAEQLTMAGFEVEEVINHHANFTGIVVARIEKTEKHPDADKLKVCQVTTGKKTFEVVCGADNAEAGKNFAFAPPGAIMPNGQTIKPTKLRGVASAGMLCSALELELSTDGDKLLELDNDATVGEDISLYLKLEDTIYDLSLTPNRGDCLSLAGLAREVGALNELDVKQVIGDQIVETTNDTRTVTLNAEQACPRYVGRIINNIDISAKTPDWVLERLRRMDLRSVNAIVDLTNYVMLELGQPMHAFDNDKLKGGIDVRFSRDGEELDLLDGQHYKIVEGTLLICDENGPVAMAGIMGGLDSAVSETTANLFLESAYFDPESIAGRARRHGLHTDASHRYERGVDFCLQAPALERLTSLILEVCGGQAGPLTMALAEDHLPKRESVELDMATLSRVLGVDFDPMWVEKSLSRLQLQTTGGVEGLSVEVPSFRFDISIEADLVEEIARLYGYNKMPSAAPVASLSMAGAGDDVDSRPLQYCLINRGFNEIITYSFLDPVFQETIIGKGDDIALANPISKDLSVMRRSLLPGLIKTLIYNQNRQQERIRLFEMGKVFAKEKRVVQNTHLGAILTGKVIEKQWDKEKYSSDFYDIKSDLEAILQLALGSAEVDYQRFQHPALHPGKSAKIYLNNQELGFIGALHPAITQEFELKQATFVFEIDMHAIASKEKVKFTKISKYPSVKRDISILVDEGIELAELDKCIKKTASENLHNLELFDVYQGEGIDSKKKSLALGLTFQGSSSTLTEEEVENAISEVLVALHSKFGATLRE